MINTLVEITSICYAKSNSRSPKQILCLYNQCFLFATFCRNVIGVPTKLTSRKFFGSHFHSLTVHAPEILRLFSLSSIVTEQEERCFGDLRRISENTTNRQAKYICENAVLRFTYHQSMKEDSFSTQDSTIKKQAQLLPPGQNSTIQPHIAVKRPVLLQAHLERIVDFLIPGEGVWWHWEENNLIFHDGPNEPAIHIEGPSPPHFRTSNMKTEHERLRKMWETATSKFEKGELVLPLKRIKTFKDGKPKYISPPAAGNLLKKLKELYCITNTQGVHKNGYGCFVYRPQVLASEI